VPDTELCLVLLLHELEIHKQFLLSYVKTRMDATDEQKEVPISAYFLVL
jgi:hypothetical protein